MSDWVIATDIAPRLRELREVLGLTQAQFAPLLGRERKQVGVWEAGRAMPTRGALERAAVAQGWPRAIFEEGGPRPHEAVYRPAAAQPPPGPTLAAHARVLRAIRLLTPLLGGPASAPAAAALAELHAVYADLEARRL